MGAAQGVEAAEAAPQPPDYLLFTDADIVYVPDELRKLVARAQSGGYVLTSLMAKLRCESLAERMFIPAFIFFFQMLYPFAWANDSGRATAAAAGGCMLVRRDALREAGGIDSIRSALIDDCALAKRLKAHGPIWIGLTEGVRSLRAYPALEDIRHMVSRTAYAQLRYSPLLLAGTVLGLTITYLAPVLLALFAVGTARLLGILAWLLMALAFQPTLRFYRLSPLCGDWRCRRLPRSIWCSRSIPPISMRAGAAACGRAAPKPTSQETATFRNRDERCELSDAKLAIGKRTPGREFSGRVFSHSSAPPRHNPGVL